MELTHYDSVYICFVKFSKLGIFSLDFFSTFCCIIIFIFSERKIATLSRDGKLRRTTSEDAEDFDDDCSAEMLNELQNKFAGANQ